MKISVATKVFTPESQQLDVDIFAWLEANKTDRSKEDSPLWSPTAFNNASRKQESATFVSALVFDFDNGRPQLLLQKLGICHFWHTTHSGSNKWRLVIPLEAPVAARIWAQFWDRAVAALGVTMHDTACSNVGRFYYVPPVASVIEKHEGRPLPVEELLSYSTGTDDLKALRDTLLKANNEKWKPAIRAALSGAHVAAEGGRDNAVTGLGFYLGRSVVGTETQTDAVYRVLERGLALPGPESKEHWEKKFKDAFERGRLKRVEKLEESRKSLMLDEPWAKDLQTVPRMDGSTSIISNTYNASVILRNEGSWHFRKNLLEDTIEYCEPDGSFTRMQDTDATNISNWLQKQFRLTISRQQVQDQADALAPPFDPLASYITSLKWDKTQRADKFLSEYFGCDDSPITRLYSQKWLVGLVARALQPGCKMDTVLVLQGAQGLGKSTALRLLTEPWFSDSRMIIGDKDSLLAASRFWLHEFAELASLKRADLETMKAFFTSPIDSYRPPYGRATIQKPRRCVYVATTNEDEFLTDATGARRFWVCSVVNTIDFKRIQQDRDQLIAEAAWLLRHGETWWLETKAGRDLQAESAREYQLEDNSVGKDALLKWWCQRPFDKRPKTLTASEVITDVWGVPLERANGKALEMSASRALRDLGFIRVRLSKNGDRRWAYRPGVELERMPQRGSEGAVTNFKVETGT